MTRRTTLPRLVETARDHQSVAIASTWRADYFPRGFHCYDSRPYVEVTHWDTPMFAVVFDVEHGDFVVPISSGHGSQSDRCGVSRILGGYGLPMSYRALYDGKGCPPTDRALCAKTYPRNFPHPADAAAFVFSIPSA